MKTKKFKCTLNPSTTIVSWKLPLETFASGDSLNIVEVASVSVLFDWAEFAGDVSQGALIFRFTSSDLGAENAKSPLTTAQYAAIGDDKNEFWRDGFMLANAAGGGAGTLLPFELVSLPKMAVQSVNPYIWFQARNKITYEDPLPFVVQVDYDIKKLSEINYLKLQNSCACGANVTDVEVITGIVAGVI